MVTFHQVHTVHHALILFMSNLNQLQNYTNETHSVSLFICQRSLLMVPLGNPHVSVFVISSSYIPKHNVCMFNPKYNASS